MAKKESTLYYFYSVGCGFCKKLDPIIDELIKEEDYTESEKKTINRVIKKFGKCGEANY